MSETCKRICALMLLMLVSRPLPCAPARAENGGAQEVIVEVCTEKGPLKLRRAPDSGVNSAARRGR